MSDDNRRDRLRILYVDPGPVPPPKDISRDRMFYIAEPVCGDILAPNWCVDQGDVRRTLGPDSYPEHRVGNFTYHIFPSGRYGIGTKRQKLAIFRFYIRHGLKLIRTHKYDAVMSYGWTMTGVAAFLLRLAARARLIIDLGAAAPHSYNNFGRFGISKRTFALRLSKVVSDALLYGIAGSADRLVLRSPNALCHYPALEKKPASIIHGFVAVSRIPFTGKSDNYILLVGAPWYLKGADLLIRAFQKIHAEFPEFTLRLVGYYPDREELDRLAGDNPRIQICKPVANAEALQLIANCLLLVLPSRTETQGRVLLEAMAAGKAVLGSSADGIPYYINHGENGLVFESGNADDLAAKLQMLLASPELRQKFAARGYELTRTAYSEAVFGEKFRDMVALAVGRPDLAGAPSSSAQESTQVTGSATS